jgi:hypothetical protein
MARVSPRVVVFGDDVRHDAIILRDRSAEYVLAESLRTVFDKGDKVPYVSADGGATHLHKTLEQALQSLKCHLAPVLRVPTNVHSIVMLGKYPKRPEKSSRDSKGGKDDKVLRVAASLGWQQRGPAPMDAADELEKGIAAISAVRGSSLVVLADFSRLGGFLEKKEPRARFKKALLHAAGKGVPGLPAIVVRPYVPQQDGPHANPSDFLNLPAVWDILCDPDIAKHTVLLLSASMFRRLGIQISDGLSWERTVDDLVEACSTYRIMEPLQHFAHVIIPLNQDATLHFERLAMSSATSVRACQHRKLFYRPFGHGESYYENFGLVAGRPVVQLACLVRGIVRAANGGRDTDKANAVSYGIAESLRACARHYFEGYGTDESKALEWHKSLFVLSGPSAKHDVLEAKERLVACIDAPVGYPRLGQHWGVVESEVRRILNENTRRRPLSPRVAHGNLEQISKGIVEEGLDAVQQKEGFGVARFGNLFLVDREEIDSYRAVQRVMRAYLKGDSSKPLAIAMFGQPGAGKSFGIKELAKSLSADNFDRDRPLEYNLSQFDSPADLAHAFHESRDRSLSQKVPLLFFDEFDAEHDEIPYGWLKYFLAPIQDGEFRDRKAKFNIGPAIIVFVGGVNHRFADIERLSATGDPDFKKAKGPDFLSRLRGFIDTRGPDKIDADDRCYLLRRAILLRSMLEKHRDWLKSEDKIKMHAGVLEAFLTVAKYKHGMRSIEAIVEMSNVSRSAHAFQRSALPPPEQLDMHVDAREFLRIIDRA